MYRSDSVRPLSEVNAQQGVSTDASRGRVIRAGNAGRCRRCAMSDLNQASVPSFYGCSSVVLTHLPQLSAVGILGWCSFDNFLLDLSTNRVAE